MKIVVTGGLGFIGSSFVKLCVKKGNHVVVIDKMTYAADKNRLKGYSYDLVQKDICDDVKFACEKADYIINFAAESHVDNSISNGLPFIKSNIEGTFNMLEIARTIPNLRKFIQISTDEVYGDIINHPPSKTTDTIIPSSYYSASKSAADGLVQSVGRTYNLPYLITHTCNNFGDNQHNEKFLPTIYNSIKNNKPIPIYGDGSQVREWIWVEDNVKEVYNLMLNNTGIHHIGSRDRWENKELIQLIANILEKKVKFKFVKDRLGHDKKYALESDNIITKSITDYLREKYG